MSRICGDKSQLQTTMDPDLEPVPDEGLTESEHNIFIPLTLRRPRLLSDVSNRKSSSPSSSITLFSPKRLSPQCSSVQGDSPLPTLRSRRASTSPCQEPIPATLNKEKCSQPHMHACEQIDTQMNKIASMQSVPVIHINSNNSYYDKLIKSSISQSQEPFQNCSTEREPNHPVIHPYKVPVDAVSSAFLDSTDKRAILQELLRKKLKSPIAMQIGTFKSMMSNGSPNKSILKLSSVREVSKSSCRPLKTPSVNSSKAKSNKKVTFSRNLMIFQYRNNKSSSNMN